MVKLQDWCIWYSSVTLGRAIGEVTGVVYMVQFSKSREGAW